eukprot:m.1332189 g.1332189  ORF g.1332189 m.1332189 type:complete len:91 (-) comp24868_c0_seq15:2-274(-)
MTTVSSCAAWNVGRYFETADPRLSSVSSEYTWDYRSSNCQQHTWCHLKGDWVTNNSEYVWVPDAPVSWGVLAARIPGNAPCCCGQTYEMT